MRVARAFFLYPVFHQAPRTSQQQCEDKCSAYFFLLHPSELTEEERWELEDIGWLSPRQEKIRLLRDKHEAYLRAPLSPFPLPAGYAKLDASRSWLLYWIRSNSIHILTPQHHFLTQTLVITHLVYRHSLGLLGAKCDPEADRR